MITGFNTDIPFEGVTYHVQTEDKGVETPLILSLVYVGGTIIASKRTPYQDLVEKGFDEQALTERLQRQHKLICAAIRAGRIADLKKMSGDGSAARASAVADRRLKESAPAVKEADAAAAPRIAPQAPATAPAASRPARPDENLRSDPAAEGAPAARTTPPAAEAPEAPKTVGAEAEAAKVLETKPEDAAVGDELIDFYDGNIAVLEPLSLSLLDDEGDFRSGQLATIKIHVGRGGYGQSDVGGAAVTIKVLGTTFRPLLLSTTTDGAGVAVVRALLPRFTSGRAAIIIRAVADGEAAELRRIIHHS